jgi:hypothetical protein
MHSLKFLALGLALAPVVVWLVVFPIVCIRAYRASHFQERRRVARDVPNSPTNP